MGGAKKKANAGALKREANIEGPRPNRLATRNTPSR
jgi:hypothetical protein